MPDKILVAVAWPYASGSRHLGHVAGFGVPSDVFARYHRLKGNDVLMVSGTDEHGTPITVRAEKEGKTPQELVDYLQPGDRRQPADPGLLLRPLHPHHHGQPLRRDPGAVHRPVQERLHLRQDHAGGLLRELPALPARPLRGGHLPALRRRRRPGRPVRLLRQAAGPGGPHQPALQDLRQPARYPGHRALLPGPAGLRRAPDAPGCRSRITGAPTCATSRWACCRRACSPGAITRDILWGIPIPELPGQLPRQAHLRLVRRRHRLPLGQHRMGALLARRRGQVEGMVAEPRRPPLLLHGQGQHRLPQRHLAVHAHGLQRGPPGALHRGCPAGRRPAGALRRGVQRVPDHGGQKVQRQPQRGRVAARLFRPLRRRPAALLSDDQRAGELRHRLYLGRVPAPQQRRAGGHLGQPGPPGAELHLQELSGSAPAGSAGRRRTRRCWRRPRLPSGPSAGIWRPRASSWPSPRPWGWPSAPTST